MLADELCPCPGHSLSHSQSSKRARGSTFLTAGMWHLRRSPTILPFYHSGMARIMPEHGRIPRVGNQITVTVGEPVDMSDLTCRCGRKGAAQQEASALPASTAE